ncbi:Nac transcription factor 29-like, partial [Thalictrum thalictroides]
MAKLSCERAKEEEEATVLLLPPGFTFRPTDIELLTYYLSKKINGDEDLPNIIVERKLYGKEAPEPWKIFDEGTTTTAVEEVKYFYTWAIKKHGSKKNYFDRVCGQGKWKMDKTDPILDSENRLLGFKKLFSFDNFDKVKYGSWVLWEYTLNTANPNNQQELTVCKMHRGTIGKKKAKQDLELLNMPSCNKKRTRLTMNDESEPASRSSSTKMLKQTTNKESSLPAPSTPLVIEKPVVLQYG